METIVAEKKVPLDAQNEQFLVATFLMPFLEIFYGTEDHLGSTRMVLGAQSAGGCQINRAMMYQAYGSVSEVAEVGATSTDPLRQKFTTKEFDEEGTYESPNPNAVIDLDVSIANPPVSGLRYKFCKITITFNDGTSEVVNIEDPLTDPSSVFKIKQKFEYTSRKVIDEIRIEKIYYYGNSWCCFRDRTNNPEIVGKTIELQQRIEITIHETEGNSPCDQLHVSDPIRYDGIQAYHFGARFYDPEVGIWNRPDPVSQYWNLYSYVGGNPISCIDPNGESAVLIGVGLAALAAGLYWLGHSLENYFNTDMPGDYAFNPFTKEWWQGTENDLNQFNNSGAGWNSDKGFYTDIAGNQNYPFYANNAAKAEAAAMGEFYTKATAPAPKIDVGLQVMIDIGNINKEYGNMPPMLAFGSLPMIVGGEPTVETIYLPIKREGWASGNGNNTAWYAGMVLPNDPSGLGPHWVRDFNHLDPNGSLYQDGANNTLEFNKGRPNLPGWKGINHWHYNGDHSKQGHLRPGKEIPDPVPFIIPPILRMPLLPLIPFYIIQEFLPTPLPPG